MQQFLLGMIAMACAVAALLFLRFWRTSRDRFFLFFSASFALESVNRAMFAWHNAANDFEPRYFVIRLISFLLILAAIVDTNLRRRG